MSHKVPPCIELTSIARLLTCAVCENMLLPPTVVCQLGHTFCESCRRTTCPTCEGPFLEDTRNLPIEAICKAIGNACPYRELGCSYAMTTTLLVGHTIKCSFRPITCPLDKIPSWRCDWSGPIRNLSRHILDTHHDIVSEKSHILCKSLRTEVKLIVHNKEVFLFYMHSKEDCWYAIVQKAGVTIDAYRSVFGFRSPYNKIDCINMMFPVTNLSESINEVHDKGLAMILDDKVVRNFEGKDGLTMMIGVEEIK